MSDTSPKKRFSWLQPPHPSKRCFVGFDGFTDEIVRVVQQRQDACSYEAIPSIAKFAQRVNAMSGTSGNIELVSTEVRIGGNGPILANALVSLNCTIALAGAIGSPKVGIEPVFQPLAESCNRVYPLCSSGHTDALEFQDGKVLLGKMSGLNGLQYEQILSAMGPDTLIKELDQADVFVSANWTMLPHMNEIWQKVQEQVCPHLSPKTRWMFVDLADTTKRSLNDLREALKTLRLFQPPFQVVLGLNDAEARQVHRMLFIEPAKDLSIKQLAEKIRHKSALHQVVIHTSRQTAAASENGSWIRRVAHCSSPKMSTGAGDHFNAGYCLGLLLERDPSDCLALGCGTAGFFIRQGLSPSCIQLASFLTANCK